MFDACMYSTLIVMFGFTCTRIFSLFDTSVRVPRWRNPVMIYLAPLLRLFADPGVEALGRVGVRLFPFPNGDAAGEAG